MKLGCAMFMAVLMTWGAGAAAFASECDPGTASAIGTYLGEVYCRGAFLSHDGTLPTCQEESAAYCKDAFETAVKTNCPTADNKELREHLIARCDDLVKEP